MESGTSPSIQALVQLCTHTACQTAAARRGGRKIVDGSPGALPRPSTCRCSSIRPSNCRPGGRVDHISLVSYYLKVITKVSPYRSRHCHIADHVCHPHCENTFLGIFPFLYKTSNVIKSILDTMGFEPTTSTNRSPHDYH